jgi:hypothetical protein
MFIEGDFVGEVFPELDPEDDETHIRRDHDGRSEAYASSWMPPRRADRGRMADAAWGRRLKGSVRQRVGSH